ncbi:hypothetical protein WISP_99253 [Willisornis vidua]|uniref:Uncharacterized protein n=1 Tax=Willisornis vidua TaxID=1566151 RepID=A0ABQ9D018_9PASS|nr:hypothetical protein WISP_99253 [Willisornis vidua]
MSTGMRYKSKLVNPGLAAQNIQQSLSESFQPIVLENTRHSYCLIQVRESCCHQYTSVATCTVETVAVLKNNHRVVVLVLSAVLPVQTISSTVCGEKELGCCH